MPTPWLVVTELQELHQVRFRQDSRDLAFRRHEDRIVVSEEVRRELDGGFRVDLRERGLHDLVTRIWARSLGALPDKIRSLITFSEIEPTGWALCLTGICENFQCRISAAALSSGSLASTYWTFRVWIWSTRARFSCRFNSVWRET